MKRVLILNPSYYENNIIMKNKHSRWLPLSIPILFGLLSTYDFDIQVCNEFVEDIPSFEDFDLVFISCNTKKVHRLNGILKDSNTPHVPVIIGGNFETSTLQKTDDFILPNNCICLRGYAEKIIPTIALNGINKKYFKEPAKFQSIDPLEIAFSNYTFFNKELYASDSFLYVESSRGCAMSCKFCDICNYHPRRILRSYNDVAENIIFNINTTGIRRFHFADSNIELGRRHGKNLISVLQKLPFSIIWSASTDINNITENDLISAAQLGCNHLNFGIESLIPENLKLIGKIWTYRHNLGDIINTCFSNGISQTVHIILGLDYDTEQNIFKTVERLIEWKVSLAEFHILDPALNTPIYNELKQQRRILNNNSDMTIYQPKNMSYTELLNIHGKALKAFYSPSSILYRCGDNNDLLKKNFQIYETINKSEVSG